MQQYNLGISYRNGTSVAVDKVEAVKWYKLAAEGGSVYAQFNLSLLREWHRYCCRQARGD